MASDDGYRMSMWSSLSGANRALLAGALVLALGGAGEGHGVELQWSALLAVAEVVAGDRLLLADRREARLAGVRVPEGGARAAEAALAELVGAWQVRLGTEPARFDRYGRLVVHVERVDGLWLQGALLERGLAQVRTRPDETARAAEMLALERRARAQGLGLWSKPKYRPRPTDEAQHDIGRFQIVRGRALRVDAVGSYVYLNFGDEYWHDFTLRFRRADLRERFEGADVEPEDLPGRPIQVRGFVLEAGGPLIEVSHPEQIEVLP